MKNGLRILIVDDDRALAEAVARALENAGFHPTIAGTAMEGWRQIDQHRPDLVILDLNLPDVDGLELCRDIRRETDVPVIMLTGRTEETDRVVGLEVGADDYVTKPFSLKELVARVKAVLRRTHDRPAQVAEVLRTGEIQLDLAGHSATVNGQPVELTRTEFLILQTLMQNLGRVVTREALARAVWGTDLPDPHLLEVHLSNLRRKLEKDPRRPKHLQTVRGVGYKMV
ncbi:MAG: response regulator transcription factor [Armatimonadetes bacterium]|nr:response regulator transcription factor [Armatimonadota bacterium]